MSEIQDRVDLEARTHGEESGVYGLHAVNSLLRHQPQRIVELLVDDQRASGRLAEWVIERRRGSVPLRLTSRSLLDKLARGGRHQGVVARVRPFRYAKLEDLISNDRAAVPTLLVLDGVEDPRNLGASARAALALGATGLIIPRDRAAHVTPAAEHVAAGALGLLPVAQVTNLARALDQLKAGGLWIVGAEADGRSTPWQVEMRGPTAIVIGGEDRGLRPQVRRRCDWVVSIPMHEPGFSLNAADAACVFLYELARQRHDPVPT